MGLEAMASLYRVLVKQKLKISSIPHNFMLYLSMGPIKQPFPKPQILDSSKLKEFADDNFNLNENGRNFSKRVENNAGKEEIARYEQFLLFSQCFQKTYTADM